MRCRIVHESRGRIRVRVLVQRMSLAEADAWEYYLKSMAGIERVRVYDRTRDIIVNYSCSRQDLLGYFSGFSYTDDKVNSAVQAQAPASGLSARTINREFEEKLFARISIQAVRLMLPACTLTYAITAIRSGRYILKGLRSLAHKKLEVSVLDALAITASMLMGDFATASSIMFLLGIGDMLEEWTAKKSIADLAGAMSLGVENAWVISDGTEVLMPVGRIGTGDLVVIRTGSMIPLDGIVESGEAYVNQSYMTGESRPVRCCEGRYVYAGTVVEEGEIVVSVTKAQGMGRYDRIVHMIEDSQKLRSSAETKAAHLADHLVPYSLLGTALTYVLTGSASRAVSLLMVDFSCALKLSIPLAVLSAMREAGHNNISVKGGIFMEQMAEAGTIVFDKTGTLTKATPEVVDVIPFGGNDAREMLRMAACLEEHYPHSMARAVVEAARRLHHEEENHSKVEYIVAHGIVSTIDGRRALIGSRHFIFEENECSIPEGEEERFENISGDLSRLYFAIDGKLAAVILVEDPIKEDAPGVIKQLHELGFTKIVMMTGDTRHSAEAAAERLGLDEVYAEVMPEDKAAFIKKEHEAGRKVVMIGDGINDTPALSEADVGISISSGAAIARAISDITIASDELGRLVTLRVLSRRLMERIDRNYRFIMGFNSGLMVMGALGVMQSSTTAMLHNISTIGISLDSMTDLMKPGSRMEG